MRVSAIFARFAAVVSQSKSFRLAGSNTDKVQSVVFTTSTCDQVFKEFTVSEGSFEAVFDAHSSGVQLNVCAKYASEAAVETGIHLNLKAITEMTVNKGDSRVLVWGTEKTFTFHGYGINSEQDTVEFVLATSVETEDEE